MSNSINIISISISSSTSIARGMATTQQKYQNHKLYGGTSIAKGMATTKQTNRNQQICKVITIARRNPTGVPRVEGVPRVSRGTLAAHAAATAAAKAATAKAKAKSVAAQK